MDENYKLSDHQAEEEHLKHDLATIEESGLLPDPSDTLEASKPFEESSPVEDDVARMAHNAAKRLVDNKVLEAKIGQQSDRIGRLQEAAELANIDQLTGIANRRGGQIAFEDMRSRRSPENRRHAINGETAHILFIDLDHFKRTNDTLGHDKGDEILKLVAQRMSEAVRRGDTTVRWGGDEFLVLLPNVTSERAKEIAELIRHGVEGAGGTEVSASIGVGRANLDIPLEEGLKKMDEAMYAAKQSGRNRVVDVDELAARS